MINIINDIENDNFHYDYLLASVTAVLWIRCLVILRLTYQFGPTIIMITKMLVIITQFLVVYGLLLITFASIGNMTLGENPNFRNLFDSLRIYTMASLGNFDLF